MEHINDNGTCNRQVRPLIQLLIPAYRTVRKPGADYAWLHGYCLCNCRIGVGRTSFDGEVRIGSGYEENYDLIATLADALEPTAVLAGMDLTGVVSALGRLPIDAPDPAPAVALLSKLKSMLEAHTPIDMGVTQDTVNVVLAERLAMSLAAQTDRISSTLGDILNSGNPHLLAQMLTDEAGACLLAMGQLLLTPAQQVQLDTAWRNWRRHLVPMLPGREAPTEADA